MEAASASAKGFLGLGFVAHESCAVIAATLTLAIVVAAVVRLIAVPRRTHHSEPHDEEPAQTAALPNPDKLKALEDSSDEAAAADLKNVVEASLERIPGETWGFAWDVRAYAAQRFLLSGIDPNSPAGRWSQERRAQGLPAIERGDELVSANGSLDHSVVRRELVMANKLCLEFLRADAVASSIKGKEHNGEKGHMPVFTAPRCSQYSPCDADEPEEAEEGWGADEPELAESTTTRPTINLPLAGQSHFSTNHLEIANGSSSPSDLDCVATDPKRTISQPGSRRTRHAAGQAHGDNDSPILSSGGSGSGSGSENATCPSTDWEYMMDNRPGSLMTGDSSGLLHGESTGQPFFDGVTLGSTQQGLDGHANPGSVVIVAGSQAMALQTASALGTVLAGGMLPSTRAAAAQCPPQALPQVLPPTAAAAPIPAPLLPPQPVRAESLGMRTPPPPLNAPRAPPTIAECSGHMPSTSSFSQVRQLPPTFDEAFTGSLYPAGSQPFAWPSQFLPSSWSQVPPLAPQAAQLPAALGGQSVLAASTLHRFVASGVSAQEVVSGQAMHRHAAPAGKPQTGTSAAARADSAPPACGQVSAAGCTGSEVRLRKKSRAGKRASTRAGRRERDASEIQNSKVGSSRARSDSAPPAIRSQGDVSSGAQVSNATGRLYYKPRRRAGKKVRQRMEHAIARRRELALLAEAELAEGNQAHSSEETCRPVKDAVAITALSSVEDLPLKHAASSRKLLRGDSPDSVSTCTTAAATVVSAVGSSGVAPTSGGFPRSSAGHTSGLRSFYPSKASPRIPSTESLPTVTPEGKATSRQKEMSGKKLIFERPRAGSRPAAKKADQTLSEQSEIIGQRVLITGLVNSPQFNGQWGQVDDYDAELERYVVRVFLGEAGSPPMLAKLRRESLVVPKGSPPGPEEMRLPAVPPGAAWQPSLRLKAAM